MSYSFLSCINHRQSPLDLAFPFRDSAPLKFQPQSLESPISPQEASPKDWMDNVLAFENINKLGLMNVMKVSSSIQPLYQEQSSLQELIKLQYFSSQMAMHPKIEEKIEADELEEAVIYKKVKVECDSTSENSEPIKLSSVVDQQLQKLPKYISEKVQRMLNQPKLEKVARIEGKKCFIENKKTEKIDEPELKIVGFKFDQVKKTFIYQVQWKKSANGVTLKNSFLTKEELMKIDSNLIVSYYEEQIAKNLQKAAFDESDL